VTRLIGRNAALPAECVLTVGKFESVHLGHRQLLNEVVAFSRERGIVSAAATFEPHPVTTLVDHFYKPLFTIGEREHILLKIGIDFIVEYPFDNEFATISREEFCRKIFVELRARYIFVGESYRFGRGRAGTVEFLQTIASTYGAEVKILPHREYGGSKVGTREIRALIEEKKIKEASDLLGFPFFIIGGVVHGNKIGRSMGYPTVNIDIPDNKFLPPDGVYSTLTHIGGNVYESVTNIGFKPTVSANGDKRSVESFILNFKGELYGEELRTEFISFLRPEIKFSNKELLMKQIKEDIKNRTGRLT